MLHEGGRQMTITDAIEQIESGEHLYWDGDDFAKLLDMLKDLNKPSEEPKK